MEGLVMRKLLSVLLTIVIIFSFAVMSTGCGGTKADYENPIKAIEAFDSGENIVGKTVAVTASMDYTSMGGVSMIYSYASTRPMEIMVCPTGGSGSDVKNGDTVVFRISSVDTSRAYVYVLNGTVVS